MGSLLDRFQDFQLIRKNRSRNSICRWVCLWFYLDNLLGMCCSLPLNQHLHNIHHHNQVLLCSLHRLCCHTIIRNIHQIFHIQAMCFRRYLLLRCMNLLYSFRYRHRSLRFHLNIFLLNKNRFLYRRGRRYRMSHMFSFELYSYPALHHKLRHYIDHLDSLLVFLTGKIRTRMFRPRYNIIHRHNPHPHYTLE